MSQELRHVASQDDWESYHVLRKAVLWRDRRDLPAYDPDHPHEHADGHFPLLLIVDGEPLGAIRVDIEPPIAWFRLIAVSDETQGRGLGRRMLELASEFARAQGCEAVRCNVELDALGFYEKLGFRSTGESPVALLKAL